jgi:hypothetical protein
MKLKTHEIFSFGILGSVGIILGGGLISLIPAIIISYVVNNIIDKYGHYTDWAGVIRRSYKTHSILRATLIGLVFSVIVFILFYFVFQKFLLYILIQGLIVGITHLILDIWTPAGIVYKPIKNWGLAKNKGWVKIRLGKVKNNDYLVNKIISLVGIIMIIVFI